MVRKRGIRIFARGAISVFSVADQLIKGGFAIYHITSDNIQRIVVDGNDRIILYIPSALGYLLGQEALHIANVQLGRYAQWLKMTFHGYSTTFRIHE